MVNHDSKGPVIGNKSVVGQQFQEVEAARLMPMNHPEEVEGEEDSSHDQEEHLQECTAIQLYTVW